jgi:hypothetical protein
LAAGAWNLRLWSARAPSCDQTVWFNYRSDEQLRLGLPWGSVAAVRLISHGLIWIWKPSLYGPQPVFDLNYKSTVQGMWDRRSYKRFAAYRAR